MTNSSITSPRPLGIALFVAPLALFVCWMGYLGWLVANRPLQAPGYPLVVSRPQILESEVDIIGELGEREAGGPATVKVVEVLYDKNGKGPKVGDEIEVDGVAGCKPVKRGDNKTPDEAVPFDWSGPGNYLIPLGPKDPRTGRHEVAAVPASPGFDRNLRRVYPASDEVLAQYRSIEKPRAVTRTEE